MDKVWISFQNSFLLIFLEDFPRFFQFLPKAQIKKNRPREKSPKKKNPYGKKNSLRDLSRKTISKTCPHFTNTLPTMGQNLSTTRKKLSTGRNKKSKNLFVVFEKSFFTSRNLCCEK